MDDEQLKNNILENTLPRQHGFIAQISKDKLEDILKDNEERESEEDTSIYDADSFLEKKSKLKSKDKDDVKDKEDKHKDKDEKNKEKEEKKKLKEEAKEEEKKKKDEEKKKKDEEKKKKNEEKEEKKKQKEEKKEEKKKEKEEKKKEKEEKKLKDKNIKVTKPLKSGDDGEEPVSASTGFLHKILRKNTSRERLGPGPSPGENQNFISKSEDELGSKVDKEKSKSLFFGSSKNSESGSNSNVNSIINLYESNKINAKNDKAHGSFDSLVPREEGIFKNKVKMNIKLFSHKKYNTSSDLDSSKKNPSYEHVSDEKEIECSFNAISSQSTSANTGLLVTKMVTAPPKRRPPTKKNIIENAGAAFTQRTGNEPDQLIHNSEDNDEEFTPLKLKDISYKFNLDNYEKDSDIGKKNSKEKEEVKEKAIEKEKIKEKEEKVKEVEKVKEPLEDKEKETEKDKGKGTLRMKKKENDNDSSDCLDDSEDFDEDQGSILDIKNKLTKKLINKQKFSDKLYPGGEKCDSTIIESKSVMSVSDTSNSDLYLNEKDDLFGNSYKETVPAAKKNPSFSGPVPPFRKERSTNLNGNKTPKSPSFGNITYTPSTANTSNKTPTQTEKSNLLTSRRVSSKPKKRPPSHIGISKSSIDTAFTLKEDDENNLLSISNQESYMTNIKVSEVKIAKKVNLLKLPSREPVKLDVEDKDKSDKPETDKPKMLKILDEDDNEKEEDHSDHVKKPLNIKTSNFDEATSNEEEEENKLKPSKPINNNRMSMFSPNLLSELNGQLNKRASLNITVNVEEKMQSMSNKKKMEKENTDNKNMFDVKLRSSDSPMKPKSNDFPVKLRSNDSPVKPKSNDSPVKPKSNDSPVKTNSNPSSELANNSFFKKRATMMNSLDSNEDNESNISNNTQLKNVKKVVDDNKSENSFIESPSLCKPSDFIKNAKNNNTPFKNNVTSRSMHSSSGSSDSDRSNKEEDKSYEQLSVMDKISLLQKNQQQSSESPVKSCPNSAPKSNFLS